LPFVKVRIGCIFFPSLLSIVILSCASSFSGPRSDGLYVLHDTRARLKNQQNFFGAEREWIEERRKKAGVSSGQELLGLAFSGGGIRSNAFQTGILSGLHAAGLLKHVDYISAVSGGSWATGAYRARRENDAAYFGALDRAVCTEQTAKNVPALRVLMTGYSGMATAISPSDFFKDRGRGSLLAELWRKMVLSNFLHDEDITLANLRFRHPHRALPIISGTHSATVDVGSLPQNLDDHFSRSFPFEFSSFQIGTIADCKTTRYCGTKTGSEGAIVDLSKNQNESPTLSLAMAVSSAVLPPVQIFSTLRLRVLEWNLRLPADTSIRQSYTLTDGGHSENLGVLPLLERGVKTIVVSDASEDPRYSFASLEQLRKQADSLLGIKVSLEDTGSFARSPGAILSGKATRRRFLIPVRTARIYYLKLKKSESFERSMQRECPALADFVRTDNQFPFHPTFSSGYSDEAIRSYFMLGRFLARAELSSVLQPVIQ